MDQKRTAGNQRFQAKDRPFGIPVLKPEYLRLALLGALGLALIIAGSHVRHRQGQKQRRGACFLVSGEYQDALTKQLEQVVSAVQGAGKARIHNLERARDGLCSEHIGIKKHPVGIYTPRADQAHR